MKKAKRILALAGVIILAGLYLVTLISAFLATPAAKEFFRVSLLATLIVPILIYAYLLIYRLLAKGQGDRNGQEQGMEKGSRGAGNGKLP